MYPAVWSILVIIHFAYNGTNPDWADKKEGGETRRVPMSGHTDCVMAADMEDLGVEVPVRAVDDDARRHDPAAEQKLLVIVWDWGKKCSYLFDLNIKGSRSS